MKTIVITGGTDGLGRALARERLDAGDTVVVIGRSHAKFRTLGGGEFLPADLTLISENRRVLTELQRRHPVIDALVLAAAYAQFPRTTTAEGIEHNFALYHLSRHLLADGLQDQLHAAANPVIIDTTVPGAPADAINWDDPNFEHGYTWKAANHQSRRATFLRAAARENPVPHVLLNPGFVRTSHQGSLTGPRRHLLTLLARIAGTTPERAIQPINALIDHPPTEPLTAHQGRKRLPPHIDDHTRTDAHRLATLTDHLLKAAETPHAH